MRPKKKTMSTPLTVGELEYGDKFIGFPRDGDDSGHGGFRNGSYIFVKARGDMNAVRLIDGVAMEQPDGMEVLKVFL